MVSVGQLALKLQAVKVGGLTKDSAPGPCRTKKVVVVVEWTVITTKINNRSCTCYVI